MYLQEIEVLQKWKQQQQKNHSSEVNFKSMIEETFSTPFWITWLMFFCYKKFYEFFKTKKTIETMREESNRTLNDSLGGSLRGNLKKNQLSQEILDKAFIDK